MDTRSLIAAGLLVGLALALMVALHETHYRRRSEQVHRARLRAWAEGTELRLDALEGIVTGDHRL